MKATRSMIALVAGLGLLTLASGLGAQQSAPTSSKLHRTDRNFITKADAGGRAEVELGQLAQGKFRRMHSGAVDPNLKAWVDKTLPTLEDHLKTIDGIQAQMAKK